jgi:putative flippase GtrA
MTNTKHLIHRTLDIGSGLILAVIIQILVFPLYDIHINIWEMFHLSLIFMVVSIARSYLWSKYIFKYK